MIILRWKEKVKEVKILDIVFFSIGCSILALMVKDFRDTIIYGGRK